MSLLYIFATIVMLFAFLLVVKKWLPITACVICVSVSLTWIGLLVLYRLSRFNDPVILAILIGGSIVGLYNMLEKRVSTKLTIFRLPFLLSLMYMAYVAITFTFNLPTISLIVALWIVLGFAYVYRNKPIVNQIVKNVIKCCGEW